MTTVHEICSCGSQFDYSSRSDVECQIAARKFREQHVHSLHRNKDEPEQHDSELDSYVERVDHRDVNPAAELDHRTRTGF